MNKYINRFVSDIFTHPSPNVKGASHKPLLKLRHGWIIISHSFIWTNLPIHVLISRRLCNMVQSTEKQHGILQFMMSANSRIRFGLQILFVCFYITPSHYHHCAIFIWRYWTYKMPVRCNLLSMWVRLSILSQLSIKQYVGLCVFSLPISFVMIEIIYIYIYLGLRHETMVCTVCLSMFSWCKIDRIKRALWCLQR